MVSFINSIAKTWTKYIKKDYSVKNYRQATFFMTIVSLMKNSLVTKLPK